MNRAGNGSDFSPAGDLGGRKGGRLFVEWLFYPEYLNLADLSKDYKRIHELREESKLKEQPCSLPVSDQGDDQLREGGWVSG